MPPRLARLLAGLVSIGLVVLALVGRDAITGDDEPDSARRDRATPAPERPTEPLRIVCDEDLDPVCDALEVLGEVRDLTLDEVLTDGLGDADAWVTLDPMPAVLALGRQTTEPTVDVLATADLALLTKEGGPADCPDGDVGCVVDAAGAVKVGVPPADTALGSVVLSAFALSQLPDLDERGIAILPDAETRLRAALATRDASGADQVVLYVTQTGRYQGVVTTVGAARRVADGPRGAGLVVRPLDPPVTVAAVVAGYGPRADEAREAVATALSRETLAEAGLGGAPGPSTGLPAADIVYALREELG